MKHNPLSYILCAFAFSGCGSSVDPEPPGDGVVPPDAAELFELLQDGEYAGFAAETEVH